MKSFILVLVVSVFLIGCSGNSSSGGGSSVKPPLPVIPVGQECPDGETWQGGIIGCQKAPPSMGNL